MALQLVYATKTYRPPNAVIPGNEESTTPVEFDLAPPEGQDLARIKSAALGLGGISVDIPWTAEAQQAVTAALQGGALAFVNTVRAVRNLTVPAGMAVRVGLLAAKDVPQHVPVPGQPPVPDHEAPIPIRTGAEFSRICSFVPPLAMMVANEIADLATATGIDPRFFAPPSGSGGQGMPAATDGSATAVPPPPGANATAGSETSTGS